jgi:hypothetical protein
MEQARYVPIGAEKLPDAMSAWERYLNGEAPDRLVQLAVVHAEFEALHPFLDGNGRLGRMIVPLFMWQVGLIHRPMFYISAFFEARRDEYYEALLAVSRDGDWTAWSRSFLEGVRVQAEDNLAKGRGILELYQGLKRRVAEMTRSQYAIHALDWIFEKPVFRGPDRLRQAGRRPRGDREAPPLRPGRGRRPEAHRGPRPSRIRARLSRPAEPRGRQGGLLRLVSGSHPRKWLTCMPKVSHKGVCGSRVSGNGARG